MNITVNVIPDLLNFSVAIATTLILFLILRHFLFKPISELLEKRKNYIETNIKESEEELQASKDIKEEYLLKLKDAKEEARNIVADARKNYNSILDDAKKDALKERDRIIKEAEKDADSIKTKSLDSLKDDIIEIAISAATGLVNEKVDKKKANVYTDNKLKELKEKTWQK